MAAGEEAKVGTRNAADKVALPTPTHSENRSGIAVWEKKIAHVLQQCEKAEKVNRMLYNRLYRVKKVTKTTQWQNRFIAMELDKHGDQYRDVSIYFPSAILGEGVAIPKANTEKAKSAPKKSVHKHGPSKPERPAPEKDPNAPKKPANAFFMYCQQKRNDILVENPALNHHDLTKLLAKGWNQSNTDEKQEYYSMYVQDKERYEKQLKEYTEKGQFTPMEKGNLDSMSTSTVSTSSAFNSSNSTPLTREGPSSFHMNKTPSPTIMKQDSELIDPVCFRLPSDPNLPSSSLSNHDHQESDDTFCMDID